MSALLEPTENTDRPSENTTSDAVIEEFLDGQPRAAYWRELRQALASRLKFYISERDGAPEGSAERTAFEARVEETREQVAALATEEVVAQFTEDSIRASLNRPMPPGGYQFGDFEFEDFEDFGE